MVFASISMSVSASGVSEQDNGNTLSVMEFTTKFKNEPINTGILDEPLESTEEQLSKLNDSSFSEELKAIIRKKLSENISESKSIAPMATTWTYLSGFTIYKQQETYYCVPASVKAAMQYLTGSSDSQDTIAKALGTTKSGTPFSAARTYLNENQDENYYVSKSASTSLEVMQSNFESAIDTYDAPPLISVSFSSDDGWPYDTSGHTMCISGKRDDLEYFRLADPYIKWADSNASMFYSKSASDIHTAISDRGNGYIY